MRDHRNLLSLARSALILSILLLVPWARAQEDPAPPLAPAPPDEIAAENAIADAAEDSAAAEDPQLADPVTLESAAQGSLLLKTDHPGLYVPAPALATEVAIRATGIVARATVTQRFRNPTELWVEGI